ncbi:MAG: 30S ribosome-binding factor RbfA [Candidatus Omnitrophica bacterium]|nr:30S ribosome-binding factor RbfA [Candidatus Omnitrophota bacterium]
MPKYRIARLESLLKREISDIIRREIRDVEFALTSVTKVILSGDLQHAKVYVSIYTEEPKQKEVMQKLKKRSRFVKGIVGRRVRMHYVPDIDFIHDKSMEEADRIFKIMQDIEKESAQRNSPGP